MATEKTKMEMHTASQQVAVSQPQALPQRLQATMLALGRDDLEPKDRTAAKMAYLQITKELMPGGKPAYLDVVKYPKITDLVQSQGEPVIMLILAVMVRDFCASMNVVRNMNEEQILETAAMLLEEAGNFRLEDYAVMFAMAKKGQLFEIRDRIDLQVITALANEYYARRRDAKLAMEEQHIERLEAQKPVHRPPASIEDRLGDRFVTVAGAFSELKQGLKEKIENPKQLLDGKAGKLDA
jgi:hypothetical protein